MRWGDFVIILFIVILSSSLLASTWISRENATGAEIVADGHVLLKLDLKSGEEIFSDPDILEYVQGYERNETDIHIESNGIHFTIEIADGRIRFRESDCPERVCVNTGYISRSGQVVACVPAGVLVRITGEKGEDDPDIIIG
jgi:hypothetical protein